MNEPLSQGVLGGDALSRDNLRRALLDNLEKLNLFVNEANSAEELQVTAIGKHVQAIRTLRDALVRLEAKIANETDPINHFPNTQIDFAAARDQISRRLDRLRESLGPKEVS